MSTTKKKRSFLASYRQHHEIKSSDTMTKLPVYLRLKPQDQKNANVESFLRVSSSTDSNNNHNVKAIVDPPKDSRYKAEESFDFNGIFDTDASQTDVYKQAVYPLVEHVTTGQGDALFFAMGSSGSGKTHTVLGYKNTPGMVQLAVDTLFKSFKGKIADFETIEALSDNCFPDRTSSAIEAGLVLDWSQEKQLRNIGTNAKTAKNSKNTPKTPSASEHLVNGLKESPDTNNKYLYSVYISMVEIYNDRVFDLLQETTGTSNNTVGHRKPLPIKTHRPSGKIYLSNVRKVFATNESEALQLIDLGLSRRAMHSTGANSTSSRSHAFITLEVKRISKVCTRQTSVDSFALSIVDLAGSERVKVSQTNGNRLVESCAINKSLMLLGQCLQKQRDLEMSSSKDAALSKSNSAIFRNSRLTQLLLSNAFNEELNQKSVLLVNIDPYGDFSATSQILRYSALAREVSVPKTRITSLSSLNTGTLNGSRTVSGSSETLSNPRSVSNNSSATSASIGLRTISESADPTTNFSYDSSDKHVAMLQTQIQNLTIQLESVNERCYEIEEVTRQEMADAMEKVTRDLHNQYRQLLLNENDRGQQFTDKKLQLLAESIIDDHEYQSLLEELELLRSENQSLRQENHRLESMLGNDSVC